MFAMFGLGPMEIGAILILGVLLFGRKLPEVGRFLGKGIVEFKKGIAGIEDDLTNPSNQTAVTTTPTAPVEAPKPPQRMVTTAPKFEDKPPQP
jgi:sec-independent protein translocase protein TatA